MSYTTPTRRQAKPTSTSSIPPPILPAPVTTASSSSGPSQLNSLLNTDPPPSPPASRKRKAPASPFDTNVSISSVPAYGDPGGASVTTEDPEPSPTQVIKKSRTNTPWTAEEERRLKSMRDAGSNWSEIAKTFPSRTEGSVKKHWYKDMHYADFAEDESAALLAAIRDYEANKWKHIGAKLGKPAKACEQYAKEHFSGRV